MNKGRGPNKPHSLPKTEVTSQRLPGYPLYPVSEDIFRRPGEASDIDPDDITKKKTPNDEPGTPNEKAFSDDVSGGDLDVPGSELDDERETDGNEDEENNSYSLGGNEHNDLDEDHG
jgi:hypothetical protein